MAPPRLSIPVPDGDKGEPVAWMEVPLADVTLPPLASLSGGAGAPHPGRRLMRVAQIAPPWIPVPPVTYGGTELMVAGLIRGLTARGVEVWLFSAGDSTLEVPQFGHFLHSFWPPDKFSENLHLSYAFARLRQQPPWVIHSHLEAAAGFWALAPAAPLAVTIHTPLFPMKRDYLLQFPPGAPGGGERFQARQLAGHPRLHLIPHGLDLADYPFQAAKEDFLLFLGRIYPDKGLHTAIRLAREGRQRLVIAGPVFEPDRPYFDDQIRGQIDGDQIVYLGPADHGRKVDLLRRARLGAAPGGGRDLRPGLAGGHGLRHPGPGVWAGGGARSGGPRGDRLRGPHLRGVAGQPAEARRSGPQTLPGPRGGKFLPGPHGGGLS